MFRRVQEEAYGGGYYEQHLVSDFTRHEQENSILLPGKTISISVFSCPKCDRDMEKPEHSVPTQCRSCKLRMQAYGNGLYIW